MDVIRDAGGPAGNRCGHTGLAGSSRRRDTPIRGATTALVQARQAIREVVSGQGGPAALDRLNAVLGHGRLRLSIGPPLNPAQTLEVDDPAWRPAVMAAANLLELLAETPDRVRRCQNPACVLWFFDTTRNRTRRWCSMAACGNRAKARRHYDRATRKPGPPREQAG
jgi:predicted RNA-binding Zn ribbon-like protein